jgi:hypothetical protein
MAVSASTAILAGLTVVGVGVVLFSATAALAEQRNKIAFARLAQRSHLQLQEAEWALGVDLNLRDLLANLESALALIKRGGTRETVLQSVAEADDTLRILRTPVLGVLAPAHDAFLQLPVDALAYLSHEQEQDGLRLIRLFDAVDELQERIDAERRRT